MKDDPQHPARLPSPSGADPGDESSRRDEHDDDRAPSTPLAGIGQGLRRLRMQRGLRQYEAAAAAGVTKAMLSAYETGKRRPSLKTLDSLLTAMDADLGDLHRALMAHRREISYLAGDASVPRRWDLGETVDPYVAGTRGAGDAGEGVALGGTAEPVDVYAVLGLDEPLAAEEEQALAEMLHGFMKLLRFMHQSFATAPGGRRRSRRPFDAG